MLKAALALTGVVATAALLGYLVGMSNGSQIGYTQALERMRGDVKAACPAWFVGTKASRDIMACRRFSWLVGQE